MEVVPLTLTALPVELLISVASSLGAGSLSRLARTCCLLRAAAQACATSRIAHGEIVAQKSRGIGEFLCLRMSEARHRAALGRRILCIGRQWRCTAGPPLVASLPRETDCGPCSLLGSMNCVGGREEVHEAIKEHAVAAALSMREGVVGNDLPRRLGDDGRVPLSEVEIDDILSRSADFIGLAGPQVDTFSRQVDELVGRHPEAENIVKSRLL